MKNQNYYTMDHSFRKQSMIKTLSALTILITLSSPASAVGRKVTQSTPAHNDIRIKAGPSDAVRSVGESVLFLCQVSPPSAKVSWFKGKVPVDLQNSNRHQIFGSGSLSIENLQPSDAGFYICHATLPGGRTASPTPAKLTILHEDLESAELLLTETMPHSGNLPEMEPELRRTTKSIQAPDHTFLGEEDEERSGLSSFSPIFDPRPTTTTTMTPKSSNEFSKADIVYPAPKVYQDGSNDSLIVMWSGVPDALIHGRTVTGYRIQMKEKSPTLTSEWMYFPELHRPLTRQTTVNKLQPGYRYKFRVFVIFGKTFEMSEASNYHFLSIKSPSTTSPEDQRLDAPMIQTVRGIEPTAIMVEWVYPNTQIDGFNIRYKIQATGSQPRRFGSENIVRIDNPESRRYVLHNLEPAEAYSIRVDAFDARGQHKRTSQSSSAVAYTLASDGSMVNSAAENAATMDSNNHQTIPRELPDKQNSNLILSLDIMTVLIVVGIILVLLILVCITCILCTTVHRRRQKQMTQSTKGKFVDASHRIHREQSTTLKSNGKGNKQLEPSSIYSPISDEEFPCLKENLNDSANDPAVRIDGLNEEQERICTIRGSRSGTLNRHPMGAGTVGQQRMNLYDNPMSSTTPSHKSHSIREDFSVSRCGAAVPYAEPELPPHSNYNKGSTLDRDGLCLGVGGGAGGGDELGYERSTPECDHLMIRGGGGAGGAGSDDHYHPSPMMIRGSLSDDPQQSSTTTATASNDHQMMEMLMMMDGRPDSPSPPLPPPPLAQPTAVINTTASPPTTSSFIPNSFSHNSSCGTNTSNEMNEMIKFGGSGAGGGEGSVADQHPIGLEPSGNHHPSSSASSGGCPSSSSSGASSSSPNGRGSSSLSSRQSRTTPLLIGGQNRFFDGHHSNPSAAPQQQQYHHQYPNHHFHQFLQADHHYSGGDRFLPPMFPNSVSLTSADTQYGRSSSDAVSPQVLPPAPPPPLSMLSSSDELMAAAAAANLPVIDHHSNKIYGTTTHHQPIKLNLNSSSQFNTFKPSPANIQTQALKSPTTKTTMFSNHHHLHHHQIPQQQQSLSPTTTTDEDNDIGNNHDHHSSANNTLIRADHYRNVGSSAALPFKI